jgi:hypothetical protein
MMWVIFYEEAEDRLWISSDDHYARYVNASEDFTMLIRHARRIDPGASFLLRDIPERFRSHIIEGITPSSANPASYQFDAV